VIKDSYFKYFSRTINEVLKLPLPLIQHSEKEIANVIKKRVEAIKNVRGCHEVSVRMTGKRFYVEMHVLLDSNLKLDDAHKITLDIEREITSILPNVRITVHTEPFEIGRKSIWKIIKEIAEGTPGSRGVHNIHIQDIDGRLCVDLHLEVSANMTLKEAHDISHQIEKKIKAAKLNISEVTVHVESALEEISRELSGVETELEPYIEDVTKHFPEIKCVHGIRIRRIGDSLHVVFQCHFDSNIKMKKAHEISSKLENIIKSAYPNITRIDVHEEPA
jgi:divalent metal cation (Fe/Co/Zn/Cd) transporter